MSFRPEGEIFLYPRPTLGNENDWTAVLGYVTIRV